MDETDVVKFLTWLEAVFDGGVGFPNKQVLAAGYIAHLHDGN